MTRILCPRASGVLAALGLVVSERRRDVQRSVLLRGRRAHRRAPREPASSRAGARGARRRRRDVRVRRAALPRPGVRAGGRGADDPDELREAFHAAHEEAYGYRDPEGEVELVTLRATATSPARRSTPPRPARPPRARALDPRRRSRRRRARGSSSPASPSRARRSRARRSSSCPRPRSPSRRAGRRGARVRHDPARDARDSIPVTLRVASGALRAACEEMGAVLVRAATRQHQGAPRRLVRAVRRRRRDGDAGRAHPGPPRRDARRGRRGGRRGPRATASPGCSTTRIAGGTHLPDITVDHARVRRRRADRLRRQPRPPRRRRRPDAGLHARRLDDARRRGRRDRAARARRARRSSGSRRRCASPRQRRADLRAQLAANRDGRASGCEELRERLGADGLREAMAATIDYAERRMRACIGELEDGDARRRATCSRRADGDLELRLTATVDGDELHARLHRHRRPARAATSTARWRSRARPAGSPCACSPTRTSRPPRGAMRPVDGDRARGLPAQRRAARRGRRRQRRDLLARRRPRARRVRPRARPGHDEQPHARQRRLHLLRDARRRPGRLRGRRRPERRARRDVEHAQHAGRGARARVPAARRRLRDAARLRRRRRAPRRRRRGPRARGARRTWATRCSPSAAATRRRARTAASRARAGGTCSTARSCRRRRAGACAPASDCGSRHREAADMASDTVGFIGLGIMGSLQAANLAQAGYELTVFNRTREKAEAWGPSTAGPSPDSPARGRRAPRRRDHDGRRRRRRSRRCCSARTGARGRARGHAVRRHVDDRARRRRARWPSALAAEGHAFVDAPVTGSSPKAEDGHADDHVRRRDADVERARPLFEVMGEKIVHGGEAGQGQAVKVLSQAVTAVNCATLAQAIVVARGGGRRPRRAAAR